MPDPRTLNYADISSIDIKCLYGSKLKTYKAIVHYKSGKTSSFDVVNPNVFLENV